jgi:flagellar biosynthesis/type III secretory pathway protein FliH
LAGWAGTAARLTRGRVRLSQAQPPAPATDTSHVPPPDEFDRPHDTLFRYAFERPGREDFRLWIRYIHGTADFPPQKLLQLVRQLGSSAEKIAMTSAERLKAEGRVEGRAEGEAKGKLTGQAELLLRQLSLRFGELSNEVQARVAAASLEQLAVYAERVLSADSLDDVLRATA